MASKLVLSMPNPNHCWFLFWLDKLKLDRFDPTISLFIEFSFVGEKKKMQGDILQFPKQMVEIQDLHKSK